MNEEIKGILQLHKNELTKVNGGYWLALLMFIGACINDAQNNPDDAAAGYEWVMSTQKWYKLTYGRMFLNDKYL